MPTVISVMLAVPDAAEATDWYERALGATQLWNLGSVVGFELLGAQFFLAQPERNNWSTPADAGTRTVRVEVFTDDPDALIARAGEHGATVEEPRDHQMPWGPHHQGGFVDPYGHLWLVGDHSPLEPHLS